MKKITNCFFFILFVNVVFGQQYEGKLSKIKEDGLHVINLRPQVRSASNGSLDHFRILDHMNNEVPYAKFSGREAVFNLKICKIIERTTIPDKKTSVIVENAEVAKLDRLVLKIGNSSVTKKYSISGSNDQKEWFGLVYNQEISDLSKEGQISVDREFLFPLNNYKYIRFDFTDKNSLPINILSASYSEEKSIDVEASVKLTDFDFRIENDKSRKVTIIHIDFKTPQVVNGIQFGISGPGLYLREANIKVNRSQVVKRQKTLYQETLSSFQLKSNGNNHFEFAEIFEKDLVIEIENQDNPALDIKLVEFLQRPLQIVTDLKKNQKYKVVVDSVLTAPSYDIVNFDFNYEKKLPQAEIENFEKINNNKASKDQQFWQSPLFMWISIIFGAMLIAYFAFGLIKDLEKKG